METLIAILAIIWSILSIILFFKIWGMTNDVSEIRYYLISQNKTKKELESSSNNKFKVGDIVINENDNNELIVMDAYHDATYNCCDFKTGELIGIFSEDKLKLKQ